MNNAIKDNFGRYVKNLRISITSRCNLNCVYCHREGNTGARKEMTADEMAKITGICAPFGINKVKITGGESTIRQDLTEIIEKISGIPGIEEVSMTTNATFDTDWSMLREAGLRRVNISLDTLDKNKYSTLICSGFPIEKVMSNIKSARRVFEVVKLNMVVMKGVNENEIDGMIEFSKNNGIVLQLIELIDSDKEFFNKYFYGLSGIEKEFDEKATQIIQRKFMQNRKKYVIRGAEVEIVHPMHNTGFCKNCTRMRITSDGKFKPCLMRNNNLIDFLTPMRAGAGDDELKKLFLEVVKKRKPYFCE